MFITVLIEAQHIHTAEHVKAVPARAELGPPPFVRFFLFHHDLFLNRCRIAREQRLGAEDTGHSSGHENSPNWFHVILSLCFCLVQPFDSMPLEPSPSPR